MSHTDKSKSLRNQKEPQPSIPGPAEKMLHDCPDIGQKIIGPGDAGFLELTNQFRIKAEMEGDRARIREYQLILPELHKQSEALNKAREEKSKGALKSAEAKRKKRSKDQAYKLFLECRDQLINKGIHKRYWATKIVKYIDSRKCRGKSRDWVVARLAELETDQD